MFRRYASRISSGAAFAGVVAYVVACDLSYLGPGGGGGDGSVDGTVQGDGSVDGTVQGDGSVDGGGDAGDAGLADTGAAWSCATSTALLCDDFEAATLSATKWPGRQGTVALDTTRHHSGSQSVHMHTDTNDAGWGVAEIVHYATLPSEYYVRFYAYQPSSLSTFNNPFVYLDNTQNGSYLGVTDQNGFLYLVNWESVSSFFFSEQTTVPSPLDAWTCVELHVTGGTTVDDAGVSSGNVHLFQDGVELTDMQHAVKTFPVQHERFGLSNQSAAMDLWMDDIVIDTSPVGCF